MLKRIKLNRAIISNIDNLAEAYNRRNKVLYKQCLYSLELDLIEYYIEVKKKHPAEDSLIKLYEKLWSFN